MLENGLTLEQDEEVAVIADELQILRERIDKLPRHRSLALAVTKLEEAEHWLADRRRKTA